jgi:site-specific recombinase XerD
MSEVAVNFAQPEVIIRDMLKPQSAVDDFLADCRRRRLSERTVTTYARTLDEFASRPDVCDLDVAKITRDHADRYLATKRKLARGTVSGLETHLYVWLEYLEDRRKIARNPLHGMVRTRRARSEDLDVLTVEPAGVRRMLEVARPATELNAIMILAALGPRRRAVASLKLPDYNRETGELRFYEKGDKVIWKPIPHELRAVLEASIARGEIRQAPEDYLVPPEGYLQRRDDRDDRVIWRVVKRVAARAGVDAHVHALRAAFAVYYLENFERDTFGLQELMGHTDPKTTRTYLRRFDKRRAMEPVRELSWGVTFGGANRGNSDTAGMPQFAEKALESSQVMGAGGFEPPFPVGPANSQANQPTSDLGSEVELLEAIEQRLKLLRAELARKGSRR